MHRIPSDHWQWQHGLQVERNTSIVTGRGSGGNLLLPQAPEAGSGSLSGGSSRVVVLGDSLPVCLESNVQAVRAVMDTDAASPVSGRLSLVRSVQGIIQHHVRTYGDFDGALMPLPQRIGKCTVFCKRRCDNH